MITAQCWELLTGRVTALQVSQSAGVTPSSPGSRKRHRDSIRSSPALVVPRSLMWSDIRYEATDLSHGFIIMHNNCPIQTPQPLPRQAVILTRIVQLCYQS